jgi:hypothetical protein
MKKPMAAKRWSLSVFTGISLGMLVTFSAHAQEQTGCPETVSNPLELLQGDWAYNTAGTGLPFTQRRSGQARRLDNSPDSALGSGLKPGTGQPVASAGSFTASMGRGAKGALTGLLTTTTTISRNGEIVTEKATGTYQVLSDCSGGSLTLNLETGPISYNFFFGTEGDISLVGIDFGDTLAGSGKGGRCGGSAGSCSGRCPVGEGSCQSGKSGVGCVCRR